MNSSSGTNPTTGGRQSATRPAASARLRTGMFLAILLAGAVCAGWIARHAWRQADLLRRELAAIQAEAFYLGVHLRAGVWRLDARLLRFQLSDDDREREAFKSEARQLGDLIERLTPHLTTSRERESAAEIRGAFRTYTDRAAPLLEQGLRGIRRNTASQVTREISALSEPLLDECEALVRVQNEAWSALLLESQAALSALQRWMRAGVMLLAVLLGLLFVLAYRMFVTPLRASLRESHSVIERQDKLASLGTLAAGVAHEIRNPLAAIKFRLYSLKQSLKGQQADTEDLEVIGGEIQRLERIVKDFLEFARPSDPNLKPVTVAELFGELEGLLRGQLEGQGIRLAVEPAEGLSIRADKGQLKQVLINLMQNGAESAGRAGGVELRARAGASAIDGRTGPVVMIEVADTGPGISPEAEPRLFDPFFSTREGGTGLGLAIAARIVEKHGGRIQYQNQPGHGAVFSVLLPRLTHDAVENSIDRG